jgi:hypothetical protein
LTFRQERDSVALTARFTVTMPPSAEDTFAAPAGFASAAVALLSGNEFVFSEGSPNTSQVRPLGGDMASETPRGTRAFASSSSVVGNSSLGRSRS